MQEKRIYALGFFDGVHAGHRALLQECCRLARAHGAEPAAITFGTHPDLLVLGKAPGMLNTEADRLRLLKTCGMEQVFVLPFDNNIMTMPWREFFTMLVEKYRAGGIVCGNDFSFGYRGEGKADMLKALCDEAGIPCTVVPEQTVDGVRISSTHIRRLLEEGDMENAVRFLGHPHIFTGKVVSGRKIGRTIGIPTANLLIPEGLLVPKFGVYACLAEIDGRRYPAVTNVGTRPTVGGHRITVEPWILDFDRNLYGKTITLEYHAFLRPEQKFESLEDLKAEIQRNALQTREFFEKY